MNPTGPTLTFIPAVGSPLIASPVADPDMTGRVVTVLTDIHHRPQGKQFFIGDNGAIEKTVSDHDGTYWAQSVYCRDLPALGELISEFGPDQVLILGCIEDAGFDPYRIAPQKWLRQQLGLPADVRPSGLHTIGGVRYAARLKENFTSCRYLLIDRDPKEAPADVAGLSESNYIALLARAIPGIAGAERIAFASSSGRVAFADGRAAMAAGMSSHTYIELAGDDWTDLDGLRLRMEAAGWAAGLGYTVTAKGGATLKRLPWDTSVFSICREVFESAPDVGAGLKLLPRTFTHTIGNGQCPAPPQLTAESTAAFKRETGATIQHGRAVAVDKTNALQLTTRIETQRYGILTIADYLERDGGRTRCQTPFRDSSSWNGILGRTKNGGVYFHDNGLRQSYFLNADAADVSRETDGDSESAESTAAELNEHSDLQRDLSILRKCHPAKARATARKILTRYAPQSPRKRPFTGLVNEVIAALPSGCNPAMPRALQSFTAWLERQARIAAVRNSSIESVQLKNAGIEYRTVENLNGLAVQIAADSKPIYLVRAPHGTGKTELVLKPLAQLPGCSVAITNRVSLVADLCNRLNLANYQTIRPRDIEAVTELGICLPSIVNPKFGEVLGRTDSVLIDEVGACWRELHTISGTLKKTGPDAVKRLIAMLNQSRVAVGVDADLSTADVLSIAGLVMRPVVVVDMTPVEHSGRVKFADADKMKAAILEAVANGEKCRIACDSSRAAVELAALIRAAHADKKIVCIHSRGGDSTAGDDEVLALLRDVNAGILAIDVLIHSPTVESGVSITVKHFDRTFGLFSGRSVAPAAFVQMMKRDRTAELFEIGLSGNCRQWLETRDLAILQNLDATHKADVQIIEDSGCVSGMVKIEPATDWDKRVVEYAAARNRDVNDAGQHLLLLLESRGYAVSEALLFTTVDKETKQEARQLADADYADSVLNAAAIRAEQRAELDNQYQLNPVETAECEKYDAAIANGIEPAELTADDLRLYEHGALTSWNRRWDLLHAAPFEAVAVDVADADFVPQLALRRYDLAVGEAYRTFFEVVGIDWLTGAGEVTADSALDAWRDLRAAPCRAVLEHSGLCRFDREPRYPVRWIGDALKKFGLSLDGDGEGKPGDPRRYTIQRDVLTTADGLTVKAPGWDAMTRCAQMRLERIKDIRGTSALNADVQFDVAAMVRNDAAKKRSATA